jgi:hypothetical protein
LSAKMSEEDWENVLLVFRGCLPRRGRKASDDRRFLEALHFGLVTDLRRSPISLCHQMHGRPDVDGSGTWIDHRQRVRF